MGQACTRSVAFVFMLSGAAPLEAQGRVQRVHYGHALAPTGAIRLYGAGGTIVVRAWDRDSVDITGTVLSGSAPFAGGTRLAYKFSTYNGSPPSDTAGTHIIVRAPRRSQVWVKTITADVTVSGAIGAVDVYTITGRIEVNGSPDALTAESMQGDVLVAGALGWVRAKSGTGRVRFEGEARDIALSTVSGDIATSTQFERGRFESMSGNIELSGTLSRGASADVDSHSGAVTLRLGPQVSAAFTVYTVSGQIVNRLSPVAARPSRGKGQELAFSAADGAARVTVRTFQGAVVLRSR